MRASFTVWAVVGLCWPGVVAAQAGATGTTASSSSSPAAAPATATGPSGGATATPPPPPCHCEEPTPKFTLFFGALTGAGNTTAGANPYGYGLGAQAGVTLGLPSFYFGLTVPWYAGNSRAFQIAADLGYDFHSGPVVLRPLIAIGGDRWRVPQPMMADRKDGAFLFEVGWHLHFNLGRHAFIGGEFRWAYTTHGGNDTSWHAWAVAGARFSG